MHARLAAVVLLAGLMTAGAEQPQVVDPFEVIAADIERGQDLRVLDFDGPHIFNRVPFAELGRAILCEN